MICMECRPIIELHGICKFYPMGDTFVHALRSVDLDIKKGEFVAIMGASGSGKSTLLNILGCLDKPSSGIYTFEGVDVQAFDPEHLAVHRNRKIGFVFQSFNLLPRTTALENVELPLIYNPDISRRVAREKASKALAALGLKDRSSHFPTQLSGGQQQRAAIARAIINDPVLLLADEPTGNLDTQTSIEIMAVFQQLNQRGMTIVLVTHETDIAEYAGRTIRFRDGKITSDTIVHCPRLAHEMLIQTAIPVNE